MGISKATQRDKKNKLIQGIKTHFAKVKTVTLRGTQVNLADLVTDVQTSIDAGVETDTKRVAFLEAAKASRAADAAVNPTIVVFSDYLQTTMSATDLADFGIVPKARAVPDVATKATAIQKRAATRKARGTMGKRQREKIVGVVPKNGASGAN
jgi:hypothetical protein